MNLSAAVQVEKSSYAGWANCYRITNGEVELIATTDVGPRIIRYGFVGGQNVFVEFKEQLGHSGEAQWRARGGHRLWAAPEKIPDTYALDNSPVQASVTSDGITLTGPAERETGLQKQMAVRLAASGSEVEVTHRLTNTRNTPRELAAWALSQMAPGGTAIVGFPPRGSHDEILLPTNPLTMWAYTDFSDRRWTFTKKYLLLRQDPHGGPQKAGLFNPRLAAGYLLGTDLFVKQAQASSEGRYPDFGCSYETFTNETFLEMETLGPLTNLQQGQSVTHVEHWSLYRNATLPSISDAEIDRLFGAVHPR